MNDLEAEIAALKDRVDAIDRIIDRLIGLQDKNFDALIKLQDTVVKILDDKIVKILELDGSKS